MVDKILRPRQVCEAIGLSRTSLWRLCRANEFPAAVRLSRNAVGWPSSVVQRWISEREQA